MNFLPNIFSDRPTKFPLPADSRPRRRLQARWQSLGIEDLTKEQFKKRYQYVADLGKGSFGVVKKYENLQTKENVAIKIIRLDDNPTDKNVQDLIVEMETLQDVACDILNDESCATVQFYEFLTVRKCLLIVMQLANGDGVNFAQTILKPLSKIEKIKIMMPIMLRLLRSMRYFHSEGKVLRDVKPENLLWITLNKAEPKQYMLLFADFGLVCQDQECDNRFSGTLRYLDPEELIYSCTNNPDTDIWSLGVSLIEMLTNENFINGNNNIHTWFLQEPTRSEIGQYLNNITRSKFKFYREYVSQVPVEYQVLGETLLAMVSKRRYDRVTLDSAIAHLLNPKQHALTNQPKNNLVSYTCETAQALIDVHTPGLSLEGDIAEDIPRNNDNDSQ